MTRPTRPPAFTLVELLVVVSIIAVLLALLTPALDKAIYHAELLQCAGKLKVVGSSVSTYAVENRRRYPSHGLENIDPDSTNLGWLNPMKLAQPLDGYDMRPMLSTVMAINKVIQCPFTRQLDLENHPGVEDDDVSVEASYVMFWGWRYNVPSRRRVQAQQEEKVKTTAGSGDEKGMYKMGDRFTWLGDSFNILAGDIDLRYPESSQASHPDRDNLMTLVAAQNEVILTGRGTVSRWLRREPDVGDRFRGPIDTNNAFDDGSVQRFNDVPDMIRRGYNKRDKRFDWLPIQFDQQRDADALQVPYH